MIEFAHLVPGRLRIRVPRIRHDEGATAQIRASVLSIAFVKTADVNPTTGSLVITYDPVRLSFTALWDELQCRLGRAQPTAASQSLDRGGEAAHLEANWTDQVAQAALQAVLGNIFERSAAALLRAVI
jgi:hypothetical protein